MVTVIVLALLLLLVLFVGLPVGMVAWLGLEDFRDIVVIAWGSLSILAFVLFIVWILVLWRGISGLIRDVRVTVRDDVRPILTTGRETVGNVTGTTRFLGETVVTPVLRLCGIVTGIRRAIAVFTGITRRGRSRA